MKVKNYKDLLAYQKGYEVAFLVYKVTSEFPSSEMYGLVSQMRRAAISVPSNLGESHLPTGDLTALLAGEGQSPVGG